jgi:hypothetical protein
MGSTNMRKYLISGLLLALLAFIPPSQGQAPIVGPGQVILCTSTAQASAAAAGTTALISGVTGKTIFLCGWHVTSNQSTSTTFQLEYGTQGGPCTTPTLITPAFSITSNAPSADHIDYAVIQIPAGAQLCAVSTGTTVGQQYLMYYSQF